MQATQIVPWSLLEILNSDNPTVQSMFLGYQLTAFIMTAQIAWKSGLRQGNWVRPLLYTLFGSAFFGAVASSGPSTSAQWFIWVDPYRTIKQNYGCITIGTRMKYRLVWFVFKQQKFRQAAWVLLRNTRSYHEALAGGAWLQKNIEVQTSVL